MCVPIRVFAGRVPVRCFTLNRTRRLLYIYNLLCVIKLCNSSNWKMAQLLLLMPSNYQISFPSKTLSLVYYKHDDVCCWCAFIGLDYTACGGGGRGSAVWNIYLCPRLLMRPMMSKRDDKSHSFPSSLTYIQVLYTHVNGRIYKSAAMTDFAWVQETSRREKMDEIRTSWRAARVSIDN
jgi:hypothetical protein